MNFETDDISALDCYGSKVEEWYYVNQPRVKKSLPDYLALATSPERRPAKKEGSFRADGFFLDQLVQDRLELDFITRQLEEREELKNCHLKEIEESISYCKGKVWKFQVFYLGRNRSIDQTRNLFSQKIFDLEHEIRAEENATWKDQTNLLKDFLETWSGYQHAWNTYSFLNPEPSRSATWLSQKDGKPTDSRKQSAPTD